MRRRRYSIYLSPSFETVLWKRFWFRLFEINKRVWPVLTRQWVQSYNYGSFLAGWIRISSLRECKSVVGILCREGPIIRLPWSDMSETSALVVSRTPHRTARNALYRSYITVTNSRKIRMIENQVSHCFALPTSRVSATKLSRSNFYLWRCSQYEPSVWGSFYLV